MEEIKCKHVAQIEGKFEMANRVYSPDGLCPTIRTMQGGGLEPKILEEPLVYDGYNQTVRKDSSCVGTLTRNCGADLKRNGQGIIEMVAYDEQNGYVRKDGTVGTITTDGSSPKHNNRIIVAEATKKGYAEATEGDSINISYPTSTTRRGRVGKSMAQTITAQNQEQCVVQKYRVRKLTPKECWRLMGFDDEDFDRASKVVSNSQLYKQAGNSIVVDVLMAILKPIVEV